MRRIRYIQNPNQGVGKYIAIGSLGIIGVFLTIKLIANRRKVQSGKRVLTDPNVRFATEFNSAINPEQNWALDMFSGADKEKIFALAKQVKNFEDVAQEYQNLYEDSLIIELQDALGREYDSFIRIMSNETLSQTEVLNYAKALYEEIDGLSFKKDIKPYLDLKRLADNDFMAVIRAYNGKYNASLIEDIDDEWILINSDYWNSVMDEIKKRYEQLS